MGKHRKKLVNTSEINDYDNSDDINALKEEIKILKKENKHLRRELSRISRNKSLEDNDRELEEDFKENNKEKEETAYCDSCGTKNLRTISLTVRGTPKDYLRCDECGKMKVKK